MSSTSAQAQTNQAIMLSENLTLAFSKYGIKIDPSTLALNKSNQNGLSQVLAQQETILVREKDFKDRRVFTLMRNILLTALTEEAYAHYFKKEELKKLLQELREFILKISNADFETQLRIAEAERDKMIAIEQRLLEMYQSSFDKNFDLTINKLSNSRSRVSEYNDAIKEIKEKSKENKKELVQYVKNQSNELIQKYGLTVKPELLEDFIGKAIKEKYKAEGKLQKYTQKMEHAKELNISAQNELDTVLKAIKELDAKQPKAKYGDMDFRARGADEERRNWRTPRVPGNERREWEEKKSELEVKRIQLIDEIKAREGKIKEKEEDIQNLVLDPDAIMQAQLEACKENPTWTEDAVVKLREALNNTSLQTEIKDNLLSKDNTMIKKLLDTKEEKHTTKLKQKHEVNTAIKLAEEQITPAKKMSAFGACPADVAAKAAKVAQLKEDMQKAKYEYMTPEQLKKKEAKNALKAAAAAAPSRPKPEI